MTARAGAGAERLLVRTEGGRLLDMLTRRPVTLEGPAGEVRRGRRFRVRQGGSGRERTYQVLAQVLLTVLSPAVPGAPRAAGRSSGIAGLLSDAVDDGSPRLPHMLLAAAPIAQPETTWITSSYGPLDGFCRPTYLGSRLRSSIRLRNRKLPDPGSWTV